MPTINLYQLDPILKKFLFLFIVVLTIGTTIGLVYVRSTTHLSTEGTVHRFAGSEQVDEFDIPEHYPKPISDMLMTTHNHIISFSLIFLAMGLLFYFNSIITGTWKLLLMIEPLISTLLTFGSIWGIRFISPAFATLTIVSGVLMYISFYIMAGIMVYELLFYSKD